MLPHSATNRLMVSSIKGRYFVSILPGIYLRWVHLPHAAKDCVDDPWLSRDLLILYFDATDNRTSFQQPASSLLLTHWVIAEVDFDVTLNSGDNSKPLLPWTTTIFPALKPKRKIGIRREFGTVRIDMSRTPMSRLQSCLPCGVNLI